MEEPKDTIVTLTVDTENISDKNKNDTVYFTDNRECDPKENPGDPEHYVSTVDEGMSIIWTGFSKNGKDKVIVTFVEKKKDGKGGADILEDIALGDPKRNRDVVASIVKKYVEGYESYNVTLTINDDKKKVYTIDPKLQIKKRI